MKYVTKTFYGGACLGPVGLRCSLEKFRRCFVTRRRFIRRWMPIRNISCSLSKTTKNRVQGHKVIATGSLTASLVHPREVYTVVLNPEWRAAAIIFVHNHPSGDPQPSQEDIELTRRLKEIADLFGIHLNDHVILGTDRFYSFSDRGSYEGLFNGPYEKGSVFGQVFV